MKPLQLALLCAALAACSSPSTPTGGADGSTPAGGADASVSTGPTQAEIDAWFGQADPDCVQKSLTGDHYLKETNCRYPDCREAHALPILVSFRDGRLASVNGQACQPYLTYNGTAVPPPKCDDVACDTWYQCCGADFRVHAQSSLYGIVEWQLWLADSSKGAPGCSIPKDTSPWALPVPVEAGSCLWSQASKCMGSGNCIANLYCDTATGICGPNPNATEPVGGTQSDCEKCLSDCSGLSMPECCTGSGCLCQDACTPTASDCGANRVRCCGMGGFCMCLDDCPYK